MGDVTGPISSLPGSRHGVPKGMKCDDHPERDAVVRLQGETDSFGCEMHDLCDECAKSFMAYERSPEARTGKCDWCKSVATDLRHARDYDEGSHGPVYRVCKSCRDEYRKRLEEELDSYDDGDWE